MGLPVAANNPLYGPFNITFFAAYNNSAQRWVNHVFNTTWNNNTRLDPTKLEAFWVYSDYNVTWNGTAVDVNWTAYYR